MVVPMKEVMMNFHLSARGPVHCIPPCSPFSFSTAAQTLLLIYWVVTPPDAAHINRGHKEQCDYMLTEHSMGQ